MSTIKNNTTVRTPAASPQTPTASTQMPMQSAQEMLAGLNSLTANTPSVLTGPTGLSNAPPPWIVSPGTIPDFSQTSVTSTFWNLFTEGDVATPPTPTPTDSGHPPGTIKTGPGGVITTPGGYKIEATDKFEWKITGPDGKTTRVWGDPHVDEGDGGKWQFKRDSTFVLGDGTRVNCSTTPYGNGATVTSGLEIISGNNRVEISDIDKGKGKVGPITQDGYAHANSFGGKDVFVMGKETDDWSFTGKEITGSNDQGETFKLGNDLPVAGSKPGNTGIVPPGGVKPGNTGIVPPGGTSIPLGMGPAVGGSNSFSSKLSDLFSQMSSLFKLMGNTSTFGSSPYNPYNPFMYNPYSTYNPYSMFNPYSDDDSSMAMPMPMSWLPMRQTQLGTSFGQIGTMMDQMSTLEDLSRSVSQLRKGF